MMAYVAYPRPRPLTDFLDERGTPLPGSEPSGTLLSYAALDALAKSRTYHKPCQLVAVGEDRHPDGKVWLTFAISREWLESETDYRYIEGERYPVYVCPECEGMRHKHNRGCPNG
jgi:hypothetical protein